jgi:hypothetical protein
MRLWLSSCWCLRARSAPPACSRASCSRRPPLLTPPRPRPAPAPRCPRASSYEDGYTGKEQVIGWFWDAAEGFDDAQRRQLLQFWSGSDGMPAEGFGSLDPAFHIVAVERLYDPADTTAR